MPTDADAVRITYGAGRRILKSRGGIEAQDDGEEFRTHVLLKAPRHQFA